MRSASKDRRLGPVRNRMRYPYAASAGTGWNASGITGTQQVVQDSDGRYHYQRTINTSSNGAMAINAGTDDARRGIVRPALLHTISCEVFHTAAIAMNVGVRTTYYESSVVQGDILIGDYLVVQPNTPTRIWTSRVTPGIGNRIKVDAYFGSTPAGSPHAIGTIFRMSKIMVSEGPEVLPYRDGLDEGFKWVSAGSPVHQYESVGYGKIA